jgi:hypothetical protein
MLVIAVVSNAGLAVLVWELLPGISRAASGTD